MKRTRHSPQWYRLAAIIAAAYSLSARGQARFQVQEEPQPFKFRITDFSVGAYAEGLHEETTYRGGLSSTVERVYGGPLIGLGFEGSVYHPNLFQYNASGDWVEGWDEEKTTTSEHTSFRRSGWESLGNATANGIFLDNKPYRTSLFATRSHTFRDYDFFNRVTVDTLRYGLNSGYSQGPVPVAVTVNRYEEETDGIGYFSTLKQTTVNLDARNDREFGNSTFSYALNDYDRTQDSASSNVSGVEHTFGLADRETFGPRNNMEWRNSVSYSTREADEGSHDITPSDISPSDSLTASSVLDVEHLHNLTSTYSGHYLRDDASSVLTENIDGSAGVRHKLYESLTSGLKFDVLHYTSEADRADFESTQYIGAWSEAYTKKIAPHSRFSVSGTLGVTHTDQDSTSIIPVIGEAHTFNGSGGLVDSFLLRQPHVDQLSIAIYDQARTIRYRENIDYTVSDLGAQTMIRLIQGNPSGLTTTTPVVVDYQAAPQGSGSIDGNFQDAEVRFDLLDGRLGIYGRVYNSDNSASKGLIVENIATYTAGIDYTYKMFRAGAEYQIYDSTFASYNAARLYQSYTWVPDEVSSLNLTLSEGSIDYDNDRGTETYYSVIARYHHMITRHLSVDTDAGISQRFGSRADQLLAAVRPGVSYTVGQLSVKAGYDFEYRESENSEERTSHMFTIRARRSFF